MSVSSASFWQKRAVLQIGEKFVARGVAGAGSGLQQDHRGFLEEIPRETLGIAVAGPGLDGDKGGGWPGPKRDMREVLETDAKPLPRTIFVEQPPAGNLKKAQRFSCEQIGREAQHSAGERHRPTPHRKQA